MFTIWWFLLLLTKLKESPSPGQPAGLSSPLPPLSRVARGFQSQLSRPLPGIVTLGTSLSPSSAGEHTSLTRLCESLLCHMPGPWLFVPRVCWDTGMNPAKSLEFEDVMGPVFKSALCHLQAVRSWVTT